MWDVGFPRNCKGNKKADCESWNIYCTVGFLFTFIIFHLVFYSTTTCRGRSCPSVRSKRAHKKNTYQHYLHRTHIWGLGKCSSLLFFYRSWIIDHLFTRLTLKFRCLYRLEFDNYFQVVSLCWSQSWDRNIDIERIMEVFYRWGG